MKIYIKHKLNIKLVIGNLNSIGAVSCNKDDLKNTSKRLPMFISVIVCPLGIGI